MRARPRVWASLRDFDPRAGPAPTPPQRARVAGRPPGRRGWAPRTPRSRRRSSWPGRPPARAPSPRSCERGRLDSRLAGPRLGGANVLVAVGGHALFVIAAPDRDELVHRIEVVDVQLAVEMVELVLERAPQQAGAGDLDLPAAAILGDHPDLLTA